jgi:hypothetical protein
MNNRFGWTRFVLAILLVTLLIGAPQVATAGERYNRDNYYSRGGDYGYGYRDSYGVDRGDRYRDYRYRDNRYYRSHRSAGESVAIIGGSAAAGAVIGAFAGGGKGAALGAAIGGVGGLIVDRATKKDRRR